MTDPARRQRRKKKRRSEILLAAKRLFLTQPYVQVSVEAIAEAADVSKATIYLYFDSKLAIYTAMILDDAQQLTDELAAAYQERASLELNLRAMARAYMTFFLSHPEYFEKLSWFYLPGREDHLSPDLIAQVQAKFNDACRTIERCLEVALARGEITPVNVRETAILIYSQWLGLTYLAVAKGPSTSGFALEPSRAEVLSAQIACYGLVQIGPVRKTA